MWGGRLTLVLQASADVKGAWAGRLSKADRIGGFAELLANSLK